MKTSTTPEKAAVAAKTPRARKAPAKKTAAPAATNPPAELPAPDSSPLPTHLRTAPGTIDYETELLFEPPKPLGFSTEVFDENELASMREMEMTAEAVLRARRAAAIKPPADWDKETCFDCGLDIEAGRLALGYYTCIVCERQKEVRSKQYRT